MPQNIQAHASNSTKRNRLTVEAYEALKAAILSGELQPRERLYETILAKRYKMSRTPVREALHRLLNEGLAEAGPDGLSITTLSVEGIRSLEQANRALQTLAAELAATNGTEAELAGLEEVMARMEACIATRDLDGWISTDQEIHRRIFQMCGNQWVWKLLLQMESLVARVRHIALKQPGRLEESTAEHRAVVDGIKSRDPDAAHRAMYFHLMKTEKNLITVLEEYVVPVRGDQF